MMNEQIKCPICGKTGIPDYHKKKVVCPCCGTDLSIYKMLADYKTGEEQKKNKSWKIATAASAAIAFMALIVLCVSKPCVIKVKDNQGASSVVALNDSLNKLKNKLKSVESELTAMKTQQKIYIVKKGDSPCRISRKLYGSESRFKEIQMLITKPLQPGDTLKFK